MGFYDLPKPHRQKLAGKIIGNIRADLEANTANRILSYFSDDDTYIGKIGYQAFVRIYITHKALRQPILELFENLLHSEHAKVRQNCYQHRW